MVLYIINILSEYVPQGDMMNLTFFMLEILLVRMNSHVVGRVEIDIWSLWLLFRRMFEEDCKGKAIILTVLIP